jgi:hypothetical protein
MKWCCPNLRLYLIIWLVEHWETSVRMAGILSEIWKQELPNMKQNVHHSITSSDQAMYKFSKCRQ